MAKLLTLLPLVALAACDTAPPPQPCLNIGERGRVEAVEVRTYVPGTLRAGSNYSQIRLWTGKGSRLCSVDRDLTKIVPIGTILTGYPHSEDSYSPATWRRIG